MISIYEEEKYEDSALQIYCDNILIDDCFKMLRIIKARLELYKIMPLENKNSKYMWNGIMIEGKSIFKETNENNPLYNYNIRYQINFNNETTEALNLVHTCLYLHDGNGHLREVQLPADTILKNGRLNGKQQFAFQSVVPLNWHFGSLRGFFQFERLRTFHQEEDLEEGEEYFVKEEDKKYVVALLAPFLLS